MAALELTCETRDSSHRFTEWEAHELVTAFHHGGGDRLRCQICEMSLARPLQRALKLVPAAPLRPAGKPLQGQHVRLPIDLPATNQRPGGTQANGRVKNLKSEELVRLRELVMLNTYEDCGAGGRLGAEGRPGPRTRRPRAAGRSSVSG